MKDEMKDEKIERKMKMWKMRKEMLDSMGEKELRAFITGYLMAEAKMLRKLIPSGSCGCGCGGGGCNCGCGSGCSCGCGSGCSCGCDQGECKNGSCNCDTK